MPDKLILKVEPSTYYSEGDLVYIQVRPQRPGGVRTEEREWGLCDYDRETGELTGVEIWGASKVLPPELLETLPYLGRSERAVPKDGFAATG